MATTTTFQVGSYNPITDAFTLVLDLNDRNTYYLHAGAGGGSGRGGGTVGLKMDQPQKVDARAFNIRTPGEYISRVQYRNRTIQASIWLRAASTTALLTAVRNLISAIEQPPYVLRIQLPGGTQYSYADVVRVTHNIPTDPQIILAGAISHVELHFECLPFLRGDRVTLSNLLINPSFEAPSGPATQGFFDSFANLNAYAVDAGTPTVASNVATLPSGTRVRFGSPVWGALNLWTMRWQWVTSLNAVFYLHYVNTNNWLGVSITGTQMQLIHTVSGTQHVLATVSSLGLVNGNWYWLQATQYPNSAGNYAGPLVAAALYNDTGPGSIGTQVQTTAGPVATFDNATALVGKAGIQANSATLQIGGNFAGVHTVGLFGPGGWYFSSTATGDAAGAWEQTPGNCYGGGPVTSFGSGRIDAAPAGALSAQWLSANINSIPGTACPVAAPGDIVAASVWTKTANLNAANGTAAVYVNEYNAAGGFLRQTAIGSVNGTGGVSNWSQISGTITTGANCAYVALACLATDNSGTSPSAAVWFDTCQVWDQSATGAVAMPYCELRFAQTPAMLILSGLVGDVAAPCFVEVGTFLSSLAPNNQLTLALGRRALAHANCQLVGVGQGVGTPGKIALDATSYGGYYVSTGPGSNGVQVGPVQWGNVAVAGFVGTYHLLLRSYTSEVTVANVTVQANDTIGQTFWAGGIYTPFTAASVWKAVDAGQVTLPHAPVVSETDLTQLHMSLGMVENDSTGGGSELRQGWWLLLPVDAETLIATLNNPATGGTLTNQWLWFYGDGTLVSGPALGFSYAGSGLPMPAGAANVPGTLQTNGITVQSSGDAFLQVDPTLNTTTGQVNQGVNQLGVVSYDTNGNIYPIHVYLLYSPRYLYPR